MNQSIICFCEEYAKNHWLVTQKNQRKISPYIYKNGLTPLTKVKNIYPFFINDEYHIQPDLAKRLIKYFDYIDLSYVYDDQAIKKLQQIKKRLIAEEIMTSIDINRYQYIALDHGFVPKMINNVQYMSSITPKLNDIEAYQTIDQSEQIYAVFTKVTMLLESNINPSSIKIINATKEDIFQLQKLFLNANIKAIDLKPKSIKMYPIYKTLKAKLLQSSLSDVKQYLTETEIPKDQLYPIIDCFNRYPDGLIESQRDIFIHEFDQVTVKPKNYTNAINFIDLSQINDFQANYLLMNYVDEMFPKKEIDNDYLSNRQKKIINYPTSEDINHYRDISIAHLLSGLNLTLFFPKKIIDQTRMTSLNLSQNIKVIDYHYQVQQKSYLPSDDLLRFASIQYINQNYQMSSLDYPLLKAHFQPDFKFYSHQFSGIHQSDLDQLLNQKYSLTGTKIETLNLCPFQYFLTYLMNFNPFEDNHYTYFGQMIHQALEHLIKDPNYPYQDFIHDSSLFPQDIIYKKPIYDMLLIENIKVINQIIQDFYQETSYQNVLTEFPFSEKIKPSDRFYVSGIIDKIMIDEEAGSYIIVDYKYSKKTFSLKELSKGQKLQLAFYLYIYDLKTNHQPAGLFYRQTGYQKEKANQEIDYRMNGVFLNDVDTMKRLDPYGKHIRSLRYTRDGMFQYPSNIEKSDFETIKSTIEAMLYQAATKIESGDFIIKPILIEEVNHQSLSCRYCSYQNICYSKNKFLGEEGIDEVYNESNEGDQS